MDPINNNRVGASSPVEYVSPETKKEYEDLLEEVNKILKKNPLTDDDAQELERYLNRLKDIQAAGVDYKMNDFLNFLFSDINLVKGSDPDHPFLLSRTSIQALGIQNIPDSKGKLIPLTDLIGAAADPNFNPSATQSLSDMLLDFSHWSYDTFTSKLGKLKEQLDVSIKALNDLKKLQEVMNQYNVEKEQNYKNPPECWDDIPPGIQQQILAQNPPWINPNDINNPAAVKKAVTSHQNEYINMSRAYFTDGVHITPNPTNPIQSLKDIISARDDLQAQLEILDKNTPRDENGNYPSGSAADTIKKTLDDLNAQFPPDIYNSSAFEPPAHNGSITYNAETNKFSIQCEKYRKQDPKTGKISIETTKDLGNPVNQLINDGQNKDKPIAKHISDAITANQNLSSKMSDELREENTNLKQWFDTLSQIADTLNKIMLGAAQKISR